MKFPFGARHIFRFHVSFGGEDGRFIGGIAPKKGDSSVFQHKIFGNQTGSTRKTATHGHLENLHL